MNIGENILKLRKEKGLSQEALAEEIGVTRQTISNWELNITTPDTNQLKILSKELNISVDELINNDIKDILIERVSNTERLAGIIIKILKVLGIIGIIFIVLMVISFVCFNTFKRQTSSKTLSATLTCEIENTKYTIELGDNDYYKCDNCSKKMNVYIKNITDWANLDTSIKNIKKYFNENGGHCK